MSPKQFKEIRDTFGLTQKELAHCLGLTQKAVSHYETDFRKPGSTVQIIMTALDKLPKAKAKKLLELMDEIASDFAHNKSTRRRK